MRPLFCSLAVAITFSFNAHSASAPLQIGSGEAISLPHIELLESHPDQLRLVFSLDVINIEEVEIDGEIYDALSIPGGGTIGEIGQPALAAFSRLVAVPAHSGVVLRGMEIEEEELTGLHLLPVTGYANEPFFRDATAYDRVGFEDLPYAVVGDPALLRGMRVVPLRFQPIRYDPSRQTARIARRIELEVSFEGINPINPARDRGVRPVASSFHRLYQDLVVNYTGPPTGSIVAPGSYVVICPDDSDVISRLGPLLDWRMREGLKTRLATTAETGTSASSILAWIQDAYDNWETPPEYICLVGDATTPYQIQTWFETFSGYHGEGDHPYVLLEGDDVLADAHIGRLSFSSLQELEAIVNKIVGYEGSPEQSDPDWFQRACLVGDPGASGYSTVIVQQCIKDRLQDLGYTEIDTIYTSPFVSQMTEALNKGDTIFSYRGFYGMSGWLNSSTYALQNGWKMPFVVTITCDTGSFASGTSRTEAFLRANAGATSPKGGIGAIGTATPGTHTKYNNCIHYGIFRGLLFEGQLTLGSALTRGKLEMYLNYWGTDDVQVYVWSHWNNLMGDSATECWTGYPQPMTVTHDDQIPVGANLFSVQVEQSGSPLAEARVCLLQDDLTQSVGWTDATGQVDLPITTSQAGEMEITVSKHDCHPYLATVPIVAEEIYVGFSDLTIDDDGLGESAGNGDGSANPGETIELPVELRNFGVLTATSVSASLTSVDPYVTILDADEVYGDIPGGATVWSADDFDLTIDPACPHGHAIRFTLDITSTTNEWHAVIDLPVVAADLTATATNLYGAGANGLVDPGETAQLGVILRNAGGADAMNPVGTLVSLHPRVSVQDSIGSWGTILIGEQQENSSDLFTIRADAEVYPGCLATFELRTEQDGGIQDTTYFGLTIGERQESDPIGPDSYGYHAFDNTDVAYEDAPTYDWVEIDPNYGGDGEIIPLNDFGTYEDDSVVIDLPFSFVYYGQVFAKATVCSNGWMAMGSTWLVNYRNWAIPAAGGPDGLLALLWDDLRLQSGGRVYEKYDEANHRFIVEWSRVRNEPGYTTTIELILYDPLFHPTVTGDGIILFQYNAVSNNNYGDNCATVGIESPDGTDGLLYTFYDQYPAGAAPLAPGRAIRFLPISHSPTGRIEGTVTNQSYGNTPLSGAQIRVEESGRTFVSGVDGGYIGITETGFLTLTASLEGFEPVTVEDVEIVQGQTTILDFGLVDIEGPIITTTLHESTSDTLGPYPIPVVIVEYSGLEGASLYWRTLEGTFSEIVLDPQGNDEYLASIPGQPYVTQVEYYVHARDDLGYESFDPPAAPIDFHSFIVTPLVDRFVDDLEEDHGWTVGGPDDDATAGIWERVDPEATWSGLTMVQPEDDHTAAPGVLCFVTDGRSGAQGEFDVDNGRTTLTSPVIDLQTTATVKLRYYRWFTNDTGQYGSEDPFIVEITGNGRDWVELEHTVVSDRSWRLVEFDNVEDYIELTDTVQLRFIASDTGGGSVVEAAVDDVAFVLTELVDVPEGQIEPIVFSLMPSLPNPSGSDATITFTLTRTEQTQLILFDVQGRAIRTLVDEERQAGRQSVVWNGRDDRGAIVPSGVYFYRLEAGGRHEVRKLLRLE